MSKEEKITLENYDYNNIKSPHLNSPFSLKALETLGIEEKELKTLSLEQFVSSNPNSKDISSDLQKERYENYVQKHEELINKAKEQRKQLISDKEIEDMDKKTDSKIYHCDLHKNSITLAPKGKINPNCVICNEYAKKYEKLKERMKLSIQLEIDHEYDKKEKRQKQMNKIQRFENQEEKVKNTKLKDFQFKKEKEKQCENERKIK